MGSHILGIDLGTVNSCVAVVRDGKAVVLGEGDARTVPSALAFQRDREIVGRGARRQAVTDPKNTVLGVKRLLGHSFDSPEVTNARERAAYTIKPSPLGTVMLEVGGKDMTPVQVSARVLQRLVEIAEKALDEPVPRAVISVPAHFNDVQRKATKLAAEYAGLEVLRLINEPTAAAFAYGYRRGQDFTLAVYDLGGGTFDISVMRARGDTFRVVATDGDSYLGGEDFDHVIETWLADEFESEFGHDLKSDDAALLRIREAAEKAKIELTDVTETSIELPFLTRLPDGSQPQLARQLSRDTLSELVRPLTERTLELCQRCLSEANIEVGQLDEILLVGGQSRMPCVREAVRGFFDKEPRRDINPDEVVAMGAALYGYSLVAEEFEQDAIQLAGNAYQVAVKDASIARKLLDEIKLRRADADGGDLRRRLAELLAQTEEEDAGTPNPEQPTPEMGMAEEPAAPVAPAFAEAGEEIEDFEVEATPMFHEEVEARRHAAQAPAEPASLDAALPESIAGLQEELEGLNAEASELLEELADEFEDGELIEEEDEGVVDAIADKVSSLIEDAQEASQEARGGVEQAQVHGSARKVELVDVTSLSLGIASAADLFALLIANNTPIPTEMRRVFTTNQDGQKEVEIRVLQGRGSRASENEMLGNFILEGIESAPRMEPKIEVAFRIDPDGILSVRAQDCKTGAEQEIRVEEPLGLQEFEVAGAGGSPDPGR